MVKVSAGGSKDNVVVRENSVTLSEYDTATRTQKGVYNTLRVNELDANRLAVLGHFELAVQLPCLGSYIVGREGQVVTVQWEK